MGILKVKSKGISATESRKLVGAFLPRQVSSFLSLYALSKGITKSTIVRNQMEEWHKAKRGIDSVKELIKMIVDNAKLQWIKHPSESFISFIDALEKELRSKGIDEDHIIAIITAVEHK